MADTRLVVVVVMQSVVVLDLPDLSSSVDARQANRSVDGCVDPG